MVERLVVVGGDAAGMSAASQARRRRGPEDLEITVFERSDWVSYSACGEPYYVAGYVSEIERLLVRTPEQFAERDITVYCRHEVTAIDTRARTVTVRALRSSAERSVGYDQLVYATGATAALPPIDGLQLAGVHVMRTLDDARSVRALLDAGIVRRAVIVGGGYTGLEMAEAFHHLGIPTLILTRRPAVLTRTVDVELGQKVGEYMRGLGIAVETDVRVDRIEGRDGRVTAVGSEDAMFEADLVVLALGSRPCIELAARAGIPLGESGAVHVDARQRTPVEGVWAAGDCAEAHHRISGRAVNLHLGTIANKQGRVVGINIGGGTAEFPGVLGTAITRVCELEIACTGLTERDARAFGFDVVATTFQSTTTAGYWPTAESMTMKLVAERTGGRLLGAQIIGGRGSGKRIDAVATALWNEMNAGDLVNVDLSYAPPFSGVWDPVLVGARKIIEGSR